MHMAAKTDDEWSEERLRISARSRIYEVSSLLLQVQHTMQGLLFQQAMPQRAELADLEIRLSLASERLRSLREGEA